MGQRQAEVADKLLKFARENWIMFAGLCAGGWAAFQFASSRAIPFNISLDLATDIDTRFKNDQAAASDARPALPVRINVSIENKSDWRELTILNPVWIAYGYRLGTQVDSKGAPAKGIDYAELLRRINTASELEASGLADASGVGDRRLLDYSYTKEPIGAGSLLGDGEIKPRERLSAQHILPVAKGNYDFVQVRAYVPTQNREASPKRFNARLILLGRRYGYEPQVLFCIEEGSHCRTLNREDPQPRGGQIHSSVSEIWLGKAASQ